MFVKKIKTHTLCSTFSEKWCRLGENVKKYRGVRHATGSNIVRHTRLVLWINKAADTRSEYVIFSLHGARAPSGPGSHLYRGFTITLGRNPTDGRLAQRRDLYLTTHNTNQRDIHAPRVNRTRSPSKPADTGIGQNI
jgi:hypothetical protein